MRKAKGREFLIPSGLVPGGMSSMVPSSPVPSSPVPSFPARGQGTRTIEFLCDKTGGAQIGKMAEGWQICDFIIIKTLYYKSDCIYNYNVLYLRLNLRLFIILPYAEKSIRNNQQVTNLMCYDYNQSYLN